MLTQAAPEFITQVMRHPRVWEWVREDGLDSASFAYDPKHTYFAYEDKGFVMYRHVRDGIYDVHAAILRGGRGIVDFGLSTLAEMRSRGADWFIAPISDWNKAALRYARACGFTELGRIPNAMRDGVLHETIYLESK